MKKNTYILIALFILLLIISIIVLQKPGEQSASSSTAGLLAAIDSAAVDKIEIKMSRTFLSLEKRGTEWFISQPIDYKANIANIGLIIHQIKNIEIKSTVSSKPEKFSVFQVDQSGTEIKLFEKGNEKTSIILGKMGANYSESYARKSNSNDILLVEGANSYLFNQPVKDWRDKTIYSMPKENIKDVHYQYGDTIFAVTFKDSIWFVGKEIAQQPVINGILSSLSNLQADDFIDSTISPKINAIVSYADVQIRFSFNRATNKYAVQSSQSPQWFVMEPVKANQILKRKKDIVELLKK